MKNLSIWAKPTTQVNLGGLTMDSGVATVHTVELKFDNKKNRPYINVVLAQKGTEFHETTDTNGNVVKSPMKGCVLHASFTCGEKFLQTSDKLWHLFGKTNTIIDVSEKANGIITILDVKNNFVFDANKKHLKDGTMQLQSENSQLYEYANLELKEVIEKFYNTLPELEKVQYKTIEDMYNDYDFFFDIEKSKAENGNSYKITFAVFNRNIAFSLAKEIAIQGQQLVGKDLIVVTNIEQDNNGFTECVPKFVLSMQESNLVQSLVERMKTRN